MPALMQDGRWKGTTMPERYARQLEARRGAMAQLFNSERI
jgi:hypothetical protein